MACVDKVSSRSQILFKNMAKSMKKSMKKRSGMKKAMKKSMKKGGMKRKAKRVSKVAKGRGAKARVFRGTKARTSGGLKKSDLMRNKSGNPPFGKPLRGGGEATWWDLCSSHCG